MTSTVQSSPRYSVVPSEPLRPPPRRHRGWSLRTMRRLKNVIVVMEWVPDWDTLAVESAPLPLSTHESKVLQRTQRGLEAPTCLCHTSRSHEGLIVCTDTVIFAHPQ